LNTDGIVAVFAGGSLIVLCALLYAHFSKSRDTYDICLWDLIKDDGKASGRKAIELGGFLVLSASVMIEVIRGTPSTEFLLGFGALCIVGRVAGQVVNLKNNRHALDVESQEIWDVASNSPERSRRVQKVTSE
jgi:hypothetical protein